jgi:protein-disulfide isomerase
MIKARRFKNSKPPRINLVMKFIAAFFCLLFFTFSLFAQKATDVLATANGKKYTAQNLEAEERELWLKLPKTLSDAKRELFSHQIADVLLEAESKVGKVTVEKLVETEVVAKIPNPTDAEIQAFYDQNSAALENRALTEIRPQIIQYLRRQPEDKAFAAYITKLRTKYKPIAGKDINALNLKPIDVLATVAGKKITVKDFEDKNRGTLYEYEANVYEQVLANLREAVFSELLTAEAVEKKVEPGAILAAEITDKLREYTEEERAELQAALQKRLFTKYKAQFLIKEPEPFAQNISVDDDPSQGSQAAPVTIVMFSDFQCSFCAAAHPTLKKVMAEYKDKIRFVVRDFPLETVHKNAFRAALAAGAANAQGKFFEYIEVLYQNQNQLDDESLKKYAAELGLNPNQFELDFTSEKIAVEIRKDIADGKSYGINSTPTIFVNGVKVRQNTAESFRNAIEKALKK